MKIVAFIEDEPIIRKILEHLGLWDTRNHGPPQPEAMHILPTADSEFTYDYIYHSCRLSITNSSNGGVFTDRAQQLLCVQNTLIFVVFWRLSRILSMRMPNSHDSL